MTFELFDRSLDLRITVGKLPHWYQPGVTYFVTFRTDDSIPSDVADLWYRRRDDWLQRHGIDTAKKRWKIDLANLSQSQQQEFHTRFSSEYQSYLDQGYGDCVLKQQAVANVVGNSLHHFNGARYHLGDFVVMPNHVHLLVCLLGMTEIDCQCTSWKKFTATKINRFLNRTGRFWQEESFDHLVRSPEQFEHFRKYILENPQKANLRDGEYLYYRAPCSEK